MSVIPACLQHTRLATGCQPVLLMNLSSEIYLMHEGARNTATQVQVQLRDGVQPKTHF